MNHRLHKDTDLGTAAGHEHPLFSIFHTKKIKVKGHLRVIHGHTRRHMHTHTQPTHL